MMKQTVTKPELKDLDFLKKLISQDSSKKRGKKNCVFLIKKFLKKTGFKTSIIKTSSSPVIFAELDCGKKETILFYSHYDVKPKGDISLWKTKPFELTFDQNLNKFFARGTGDAKGQIYALLEGIKQKIEESDKTKKDFKYNVDLLFEGDEESESPSLEKTIENNIKKDYKAVIVIDSNWINENPVIFSGCKGQISINFSFDDERMTENLHAGNFGGSFEGSARFMAENLINFIKETENQIKAESDENCISLTHFNSGDSKRSTIPKKAFAKVDVRYTSDVVKKMLNSKLIEFSEKTKIKYQILQEEDGFFNHADDDFIESIKKINSNLQFKNYTGAYLPLKKMDRIKAVKYVLPFAQQDEHNHSPNENISLSNILYGINFTKELI